MAEKLTGVLEDVDIIKRADMWGKAVLVTEERSHNLTGVFMVAKAGDRVTVEGRERHHNTYGEQFQVFTIAIHQPAGRDGVRAWLASRCPGVGPITADAMIDRWGTEDGLWEVIENQPDQLTELPRVNAKLADAIHNAYIEFKGEREGKSRLLDWGLTESQIQNALKAINSKDLDKLAAKIQTNPYWLCEHARGFGFKRADAIAHRLGIPRDSEVRVASAMLHETREGRQAGHTFMYGGAIVNRVRALLRDTHVTDDMAHGALQALVDNGSLIRELCERTKPDGSKVRSKRYYLVELYKAESAVIAGVERLLGFATRSANTNEEQNTPVATAAAAGAES